MKRNDSAARSPMVIVGRSGPFAISQTQLGRIWPGGIQRARELGNQVLRASDILGRPYKSPGERESCYLALDWLKSRAVPWPRLTSAGFVQNSIFDVRAENLRSAFRTGDPQSIQKELVDFLELFESLEKLFARGHGIGRDVVHEVIDMGLEAAPLVAFYPDGMYALTQCMWRMSGYDSSIIQRMINAISPIDQQELQDHAKNLIIQGANVNFSVKIIACMTTFPESAIETLVLAGVI